METVVGSAEKKYEFGHNKTIVFVDKIHRFSKIMSGDARSILNNFEYIASLNFFAS